jgi:outer membrane protein
MKHTLKIGALICASLLATSANADTVLGGYVGIQAWNMGVTGGFAQNDSLADFTFEEEVNPNFYIALEHLIPILPNIKLARTTMDTSGATTINSQFTFGDEVFLVNSNLQTNIEMTATDYILYFEVLDNDLISFDIGVNGKQIDSTIMVKDDDGLMSQQTFDGIIPMGYAKLVVGLPLTGLSLFAEGSALAIDDDSFTDYQVGISYSFVESLALDMYIHAGYRSTELDIEDLDDINANLEFDGAFIGLEFDF